MTPEQRLELRNLIETFRVASASLGYAECEVNSIHAHPRELPRYVEKRDQAQAAVDAFLDRIAADMLALRAIVTEVAKTDPTTQDEACDGTLRCFHCGAILYHPGGKVRVSDHSDDCLWLRAKSVIAAAAQKTPPACR